MSDDSKITIAFQPVGSRVLVILQGAAAETLDWKAAKEQAIELKRLAQASTDGQVQYLIKGDGRGIAAHLDVPTALRISAGLHHAGAVAEEVAKADQVAGDGALMIRMAMPFGITDRKPLQNQAWTDAQWDSRFRRFPLRGVPSQERLGVPTIIQQPPLKEQSA